MGWAGVIYKDCYPFIHLCESIYAKEAPMWVRAVDVELAVDGNSYVRWRRIYESNLPPISNKNFKQPEYLVYMRNPKRLGLAIDEKSLGRPGDSIKQHSLTKRVKKCYNMRKFNLEEARNGAPVQTKDGRTAKIVHFDFVRGLTWVNRELLVIVKNKNSSNEHAVIYSETGKYLGGNIDSYLDLVMAPVELYAYVWRYNNNIYISEAFYSLEAAHDNSNLLSPECEFIKIISFEI